MLGERASLDQNLALAAGLAPATDAVDIGAEVARGVEQRRTNRDIALPP